MQSKTIKKDNTHYVHLHYLTEYLFCFQFNTDIILYDNKQKKEIRKYNNAMNNKAFKFIKLNNNEFISYSLMKNIDVLIIDKWNYP